MNDLIYNQKKIPADQWRYGMRASADTGCGWIATYNALRLLGYRVEPEALIADFERQVPAIHGNLGTNVLAPAVYMKQAGFPATVLAQKDEFDRAAKEADVCILFYHWRKGARFGTHFVAVEYKDGRFVGYNTFKTSDGPDDYGQSLQFFLLKQKFFAPVLIAIKDKR